MSRRRRRRRLMDRAERYIGKQRVWLYTHVHKRRPGYAYTTHLTGCISRCVSLSLCDLSAAPARARTLRIPREVSVWRCVVAAGWERWMIARAARADDLKGWRSSKTSGMNRSWMLGILGSVLIVMKNFRAAVREKSVKIARRLFGVDN